MRIDSIRLQNYRCHVDLTVNFRPGFNVIVGVNGSGKTTLLQGVCDALASFVHSMPSLRGGHGPKPMADDDLARLNVEHTNGRYRFEPQYPVTISAKGELFSTVAKWTITKESQVSSAVLRGTPPALVLQKRLETKLSEVIFPALVFYHAGRSWKQGRRPPSEVQAATLRNSRADAYFGWRDASDDRDALLTWAISKSLERLQAATESGRSFDEIEDDELALVNDALSLAVKGLKGIRYDLKRKSLLVEWQSAESPHQTTPFENLSDGQRAVIGLVSDIARRMCLLNPQLGQEVARKTDGVILIDELDVHLHPHWQRMLTNGLRKAFPAVQFIVASHSPQVLGELSPEEIILLRPEGTAHPQVSYGLDSSRVLEEIMGATARTPEIESALSDLFTALERNKLDEARQTLQLLKDKAPGIPELGGAEALLKRKEIVGR